MKRYTPRVTQAPLTKGSRVYLYGDKNLSGVILTPGPEQSEVKFDNGNVCIASNSWLTVESRRDA